MKKLVFIIPALATALAVTSASAEGYGKKHEGKAITKSEYMQKASERFSNMDKDGSGTVTKDERKAWHKVMKQKRSEKKAERKEKREDRKEKRAERKSQRNSE